MTDVWVLVTDEAGRIAGAPVTAKLKSGPTPGHVPGVGEVLSTRTGKVGEPFALRSTDEVQRPGCWWEVSIAPDHGVWNVFTPVLAGGGSASSAVLVGALPQVPQGALPPHWDAATIGAIPETDRGVPGGVATLDQDGLVPVDQLPAAQGGGVQSVTPADPSITVTGTAEDPRIAANVGTGAGQVAAGDDPRFTDARTPTAHAASHASGGADPVTPGAIGAATVAAVQARLEAAQDLADVSDPAQARQNLGLGSSATRDVGTTASDVAAGDRGLPDASGVADGWVATVDDEGWIVAAPPAGGGGPDPAGSTTGDVWTSTGPSSPAAWQAPSGGGGPIVGTGSPVGVVSAPPGTQYVDQAGTCGAHLWLKLSGIGTSGWQVTHGDTGWRDIAGDLPAGLLNSGTVALRRTNQIVHLAVNVKFASDTGTTPVSGYTPPAGFATTERVTVSTPFSGSTGPITNWWFRDTGLYIYSPNTTGGGIRGGGSWAADQPWPTSLPGIAYP